MDIQLLLGITCFLVAAVQGEDAAQEPKKPVVFVAGADGPIGEKAVAALSSMYGEKMDIRVGVENLAKAEKMKNMTGVSVFQVKLGQKAKLKKFFEHADAVYIVSSGVAVKDRAKKVIKTAKAVKEAGVEYLLVYSMVAADLPNTTFGGQYSQIESEVSRLGVPYTILRLPTLVDNIFAYRASIKKASTIYWVSRPDAPFTPVTTEDGGVAAAAILNSPRSHVGKTYTVVSDRVSYDKIAAEFTNELGRPIGYVRIPYENAKAFLQKHGFTKTRAEAIMEMYRLIDAGSPVTNRQNLDDYSEITGGQKPTSVRAWIKKHAFLFK